MAGINLFTFQDAIDHVVDFLGADPSQSSYRDARRAILSAYRDVATAHKWSYYYSRGRLDTVAPYNTGTIAYTNSTRTITLTGGTFPSWVPYGTIILFNVPYQVAGNPTSTTLLLSVNSNPGTDIVAGTPYYIYRDTYPLPSDFISAEEFINTSNYLHLWYEPVRTWLRAQRIVHSPAAPHLYTFRGDPHYFGTMAVSFFPPPDQVYHFDFVYQRRPRPLLVDAYTLGTVSVTSGDTTVTGNGGTWPSNFLGSTIRIGGDGVTPVSGLVGLNPFVAERVITTITSTTALEADQPYGADYANVNYTISDPVDLEDGAMLTCFLRALEKQVAIDKKMKDRADIMKMYDQALILAREADNRNFTRRAEVSGRTNLIRLRDFPRGPDIS